MIEAYKMEETYTFTHQEGVLLGYKFPEAMIRCWKKIWSINPCR